MANWVIDPTKNEGYPSLTVWPPEWETGWTSNDNIRYPDLMWRIKAGVNEGYPWIYPWFKEDSSDEGDMEIGGAQTNYPNGFTTVDDGGVRDQFNNDYMDDNDWLVDNTNNVMKSIMSSKLFALSAQNVQQVILCMNSPSLIDAAQIAVINGIMGGNIYDGILLCKMYPFSIKVTGDGLSNELAKIYGIYPLYKEGDTNWGHPFHNNVDVIQRFNLGSIRVDVQKAFEVENITWSICLPFAGVHPIDIRAKEYIKVTLAVDILTGVGEYTIRQDGQITNIVKATFGVDVPINTVDGAMMSNMFGSVVNAVSPMVGAATTAIGGPAGAVAGGLVNMTSQTAGAKFNVSAPQIGSLVSFNSYPRPRLIAKIPKLFNEAFGYEQIIGSNRSTTYMRLSNCSGITQTKGYKCDIIVATEDEKNEIERLMDAGVIL